MENGQIQNAAHAILDANILLFHLGAGMSADSSLPTFVDVAKKKAYDEKNLTYIDLSKSDWLKTGLSVI